MRTYPLSPSLRPPLPRSPDLKETHYEVCKKEGMTDEEIAKDWAEVEKELQAQFLQVVEGDRV